MFSWLWVWDNSFISGMLVPGHPCPRAVHGRRVEISGWEQDACLANERDDRHREVRDTSRIRHCKPVQRGAEWGCVFHDDPIHCLTIAMDR